MQVLRLTLGTAQNNSEPSGKQPAKSNTAVNQQKLGTTGFVIPVFVIPAVRFVVINIYFIPGDKMFLMNQLRVGL